MRRVRVGVAVAVCSCLIFGVQSVGDVSRAASGVLAWKQLHPASVPSGRWEATQAYDPATGQVVLFSGDTLSGPGDTWTFDGASWTKHVTTATPPARNLAGLAYDPASKQLVLFKGFTPDGLTDTWTWNGSQWTLRHPATTPGGTQGCMATDDDTGQLILFGGKTFDEPGNPGLSLYGGTWTWSNGNWTQLSPAASPPAGTCAMTYDAAHHELVLVQTWGSVPYQTWTYDGTTWTQRADAPNPPNTALDFTTIAYDPDLGSHCPRRRYAVRSYQPYPDLGMGWHNLGATPAGPHRPHRRDHVV